MSSSYHYHGHVHAEIVDFKQLRLGKHKNEHSNELGYGDTTENLRKDE